MPKKTLKILSLLILCGIVANCSTDNSSWMQDGGPQLNKKTLTQITLPGTHFASAYGITANSIICKGETQTQSLTDNAKIFQQLEATSASQDQKNVFLSTLNTQDIDISHQLAIGVRYLELQVCQQDNNYYTSNLYLTDQLSKIAMQINDFLKSHPQEIIIIDLDNNLRTENGLMNNQDIISLHNYLYELFGSRLIDKNKINNPISNLVSSHSQIAILSSNPILNSYADIINKNNEAVTADPAYPTIKKITLLESYLGSDTAPQMSNKLNILPIYSNITFDVLSTEMYQNDQDQQIVLNYLEQHVGGQPSIVVGTRNNIDEINNIIINQASDMSITESHVESATITVTPPKAKSESAPDNVTESDTVMQALPPASLGTAAIKTASATVTSNNSAAQIKVPGINPAPLVTPSPSMVIPSAQMSPPSIDNLLLK